jgi:hypothetical protein
MKKKRLAEIVKAETLVVSGDFERLLKLQLFL